MRYVLAELLHDVASRTTAPASSPDPGRDEKEGDPWRTDPDAGHALDDTRSVLEEAAARASKSGGWSNDEPLRLWKRRLTWLLHCPKRAVTTDEVAATSANADDLVMGLIVDAAAKLLALGAQRPVTVETAVAFLDACEGEERGRRHLLDIGEPAAAKLLAEAATRLERLTALWPELEPAWWPRVEEPVRVPLAGGAVVLGGKLDVLLGGPPTGRPSVIVEIKGGRWHDSVRGDAHFYGLLVGLRDGVLPAAVASVAVDDGKTQIEPVRPAVLRHAAEKVTVALEVAAGLASGEVPEARPGSHCVTCPLRTTCPAAREAGSRDAGTPQEPDDDHQPEPGAGPQPHEEGQAA